MEKRIQLVRDNEAQENILLSVLPKYIANDMKKDIDNTENTQMFHKVKFCSLKEDTKFIVFWAKH